MRVLSADSTGPVGRRLDFEVVRALEWHDGDLTPLPTASWAEGAALRAAADDPGRTPGGLAMLRAAFVLRRGGSSPGAVADVALRILIAVACGLAFIIGLRLATAALGDPSEGPVDLAWLLASLLGVQLAFLALSITISLLRRRRGSGGPPSAGAALGRGLVAVAARIAAWGAVRRGSSRSADVPARVVARLAGSQKLVPLAFATSHGAWCAFNGGALLGLLLALSAQQHAFAWESTLVEDEGTALRLLRAAVAPAAFWPGLPTEEQVSVSRLTPGSRHFVVRHEDRGEALRLRQRWARQVVVAVVGYGLVPRLGFLALALISWRVARQRVGPTNDDPYVDAVHERLFPRVRARPSLPGAPPEQDSAEETKRGGKATKGGKAKKKSLGAPSWHAVSWLSAAAGRDASAALWGRAPVGWTTLPRLVGRKEEELALKAVSAGSPPRGLVLLCDYGATPDFALLRLLREVQVALGKGGRLVVALTGGETFRQSRRGQAVGAVARRRDVWTEAVVRCGVPPGHVLDVDPDSSTPGAREALARTLGIEVPVGSGPPAKEAFERALVLVEAAAPRWREELSPLAEEDRGGRRLALAAAARLAVDACFGVAAEGVGLKPGTPRAMSAARAALTRCLDVPADLRREALEVAAGSLAGMAGVLVRVRRLDARFVAAGFAAGFLAGPLAGAIAAGSAGLVAGASLASTFGALGAALGGAVSWQWGRDAVSGASAEDGTTADDLLGLPARTAVLRALVLAWQERGETAVVEALDRIAAEPVTGGRIDTVADVADLIDAAREIGAPT